jgi:hypothetical protein
MISTELGALEIPASPMMKEAMISGSTVFIARLLSSPSIPENVIRNVVNYWGGPNRPFSDMKQTLTGEYCVKHILPGDTLMRHDWRTRKGAMRRARSKEC